MPIKEIPTNIKTYYHLMLDETSKKLDEALKNKEILIDKVNVVRKTIVERYDVYSNNFKINLNDYKEFIDNVYSTGEFYRVAKGLFINRNNDYELVSDLHNLYKYAKFLKDIHDLDEDMRKYRKLLSISFKSYTDILRTFYTEVHKQLILNGNGYAFTGNTGWICVNRIILRKRRPTLDYAATKKREAELLSQGKRIYNKEEAEWCAKNGINYEAEDKRVFRNDEYCYEIPLISCRLPNGNKVKLESSDYRHIQLRGKTNDEIIEMCNKDTNKICSLGLDLKTKLTLCDKADKILYTKFIRNEAQQSIVFGKTNSKNRQ